MYDTYIYLSYAATFGPLAVIDWCQFQTAQGKRAV